MRAIDSIDGRAVIFKKALLLSAYLFPRPGELRHMEWTEIQSTTNEWIIPASKMKMKKTHIVPLAPTPLDIINSLGHSKEQMSVHGFRAMASTTLNTNGWNSDLIERQLAHIDQNSVRAAYNHADFLPERKKMMFWWAEYLDNLRKD